MNGNSNTQIYEDNAHCASTNTNENDQSVEAVEDNSSAPEIINEGDVVLSTESSSAEDLSVSEMSEGKKREGESEDVSSLQKCNQ